MKRSERRAQLLQHIEDYNMNVYEEVVADRILAEEELLMREPWEPESAAEGGITSSELPKALRIVMVPKSMLREDPPEKPFIVPNDGDDRWAWKDGAEQLRGYEAAVAAYNRKREEEEAAAAAGPDFDAKLAQVAGEELEAAIDKAVWEERKLHSGSVRVLVDERNRYRAHAKEAESALHRLAREAGVPDDGPDEIVGAVLAKLREAVAAAQTHAKGRENAEDALRAIEKELGRPDPLTYAGIANEAINEIRRAWQPENAIHPSRGNAAMMSEPDPLGPARSQPFADAVAALAEVRRSFSEAVRNGVEGGRFTTKKGAVTIELQWPWFGGYPEKNHDFRLYVEGRFNPKPVESKK